MDKIVIVEDEAIIRKGLVYTIDWNALGCTIIGEADSGDAGLRMILEKRPDIVITDIRMNQGDGLTMLEKACHEYEFVSIVLSGHSEFDYAQHAMRLNTVCYLLKPIDEEKLRSAIEKAQSVLKRIRHAHQWEVQSEKVTPPDAAFLSMPDMIENYYARQTLEMIRQRYSEHISLRSAAAALSINESYLARKLKESTGMTFSDCLNQYRISRAIHLMCSTEMRIGETADACGFAQYKQFSIVFRRYVGMSPSDYIRKTRK